MATAAVARRKYAPAVRDAMAAWCATEMRWGVDDCALAIANIDRGILGVDPAAPWRGRYRTKIDAKRVLGTGGLPRALASAARRHGWKRIKPRDARTGDRGIVETPEGAAIVVFYGRRWVGRKDFGFSALDRTAARIAYSIG